MSYLRERKQVNKPMDKNRSDGHVGKDARRAMTVKLQRELMEQTRSRSDGGADDAPPEAQAVEQTEESAVNLAGGVRERTKSGIAKAKRRKREKQEKRSSEQSAAPTPTPTAEDGAPPIRERN